MSMPAGTYYIGDLCYVMHDKWDEFCEITIDGDECLNGEFKLSDGTLFATYGTKYGDGVYYDQNRHSYSVDAGLIGCVSIDHVDEKLRGDLEAIGKLGRIVEFKHSFYTGSHKGWINIGHIEIDTAGIMDEEEDWYEGDDDYALEEEF